MQNSIDLTAGNPTSSLGRLLDIAESKGFRRVSNYTGLDQARHTPEARLRIAAVARSRWAKTRAQGLKSL